MAYFRGDTYIWSDGERLHLWDPEGNDFWEDRYEDENGQRVPGWENGAGVAINVEIIDQLAMMRVAELLVHKTPEQIERLIDQAILQNNFGADCLMRNEQTLTEAFRSLKLEKPQRD